MSGAARPGDRLQDGIYWQSGRSPGDHFRLLILHATHDASVSTVHACLSALWTLLQGLRDGRVPDLAAEHPGEPAGYRVPTGDLTALLGFGAALFGRAGQRGLLPSAARPRGVTALLPFGAQGPFRALRWDPAVTINDGEGTFCLQLIAKTEVAVARAAVAIARHLVKQADAPLRPGALYAGFHRDDRRSWIGFHDGLNNMRGEERAVAMEATAAGDTAWMDGGTFMTFLKVRVDLDAWEVLDRAMQERMVGRTKLTGCPILGWDANGAPRLLTDCPTDGQVPSRPAPDWLDPPREADAQALRSHIHRSNFNRGDPREDANNRIFRQGYEFLDWGANSLPEVGLNFVGFARSPAMVRNVLSTDGWLGDANFGGPANAPALLSLLAGGVYAVPPDAEPFPGAELLAAHAAIS
jgi:deferrochelatase/peroxidase EfeB